MTQRSGPTSDREDPDGPEGSRGPDRPRHPASLQPSQPGPLVVAGAVAAVLGWLIRPLAIRLDLAEPVIPLWSVAVAWLLALSVAVTAYRTWRVLQHPRPGGPRFAAHQAVNRLLLGKAAALVGALVLGAYAGSAIAHLGVPATELATERLVRAALSALAGAAILVAGLALERACRVRDQGD